MNTALHVWVEQNTSNAPADVIAGCEAWRAVGAVPIVSTVPGSTAIYRQLPAGTIGGLKSRDAISPFDDVWKWSGFAGDCRSIAAMTGIPTIVHEHEVAALAYYTTGNLDWPLFRQGLRNLPRNIKHLWWRALYYDNQIPVQHKIQIQRMERMLLEVRSILGDSVQFIDFEFAKPHTDGQWHSGWDSEVKRLRDTYAPEDKLSIVYPADFGSQYWSDPIQGVRAAQAAGHTAILYPGAGQFTKYLPKPDGLSGGTIDAPHRPSQVKNMRSANAGNS